MSNYRALSPDVQQMRWITWDGEHDDVVSLSWENEAWTASGVATRERVQYVVRLSPTWQVRQFLLFRDLPEPDLWLATDGAGRWGEMNGAHRTELDGCYDVTVSCSAFTVGTPVRRLPLHIGHSAEVKVLHVDVDTLDVAVRPTRITRLDEHRWSCSDADGTVAFDVDEFGLVLDVPDRFRRAS